MTAARPNLNDLGQEFHKLSEQKGWIALNRTDSQYINLMISELSEAIEAFRDNKDIGEVYYEVTYVDPVHGGEKHTEVPLPSLPAVRAQKDVLKAKPCGIPIELADCIIRILQYTATKGLDIESIYEGTEDDSVRDDFNDMIADATASLAVGWIESPGFSADEVSETPVFVGQLAAAIKTIENYCIRTNIDIWHWVDVKHQFNQGRPVLHGGKKI